MKWNEFWKWLPIIVVAIILAQFYETKNISTSVVYGLVSGLVMIVGRYCIDFFRKGKTNKQDS